MEQHKSIAATADFSTKASAAFLIWSLTGINQISSLSVAMNVSLIQYRIKGDNYNEIRDNQWSTLPDG